MGPAKTLCFADGWECDIYQQWSFPERVITAWDRLAAQHGDFSIFVGYDWFRIWWDAFGQEWKLQVLVLKQAGEIKAVFPCGEGPAVKGKKQGLSSLTNSHSSYFSFLVDSDSDISSLLCSLLLNGTLGFSQIHCRRLLVSADKFNSFVSRLTDNNVPFHLQKSPYAPWVDCTGDWSDFYKKLRGKFRSSVQRYHKKASSQGSLRLQVMERGDRLDEFLDIMFEIEGSGWKGRNGSAIKCIKEVENFYRQLAHWAMAQGKFTLLILSLDNKPIAASYCLKNGKTLFQLKTGYHEQFNQVSPGKLLHFELFQYLFGNTEVDRFNFLGECDLWKMDWTDQAYEFGAIKIYRKSLQGWGWYAAQHGWKTCLKKFGLVQAARKWLDLRNKRMS